MKKVFNILKKPFTTVLFAVVGLCGSFAIGTAITLLSDKQINALRKVEMCQEAFDVLCVQIHSCTGETVSECDSVVTEKQLCNISLPGTEALQTCKEELRNIECDSDLPTSCSLFMEIE